MSELQGNRRFMQCPDFGSIMLESDQQRGVPHPPHGKAVTGELIELPPFEGEAADMRYMDVLDIRRSERAYAKTPMTQEQLAFILWSAQGVQDFRGAKKEATFRPVPSGGARHPFEIYAVVKNVEGLRPGLYRYAPMAHVGEKTVAVEFLSEFSGYASRTKELLYGQGWTVSAPVLLFISCIPYRAEWRYSQASHRVMLIDLGHLGQNIMLSAAALGLGSCCLASYDQRLCNEALGLDGTDEYVVYVLTVGKPKGRRHNNAPPAE